jgi:hypothetical protein
MTKNLESGGEGERMSGIEDFEEMFETEKCWILRGKFSNNTVYRKQKEKTAKSAQTYNKKNHNLGLIWLK